MYGALGDGVSQNKTPSETLVSNGVFYPGDEETRTPDIRVANAALYQLSYVPRIPGLNFGFPRVRLALRKPCA
jgi:hypothetical protein